MKQAASRPKPAIAERGIGFELLKAGQFEPVLAQRPFERAGEIEIVHRIAQQPPDQEFEAEVIDPLRALGIGAAGAFHPAVDHLVAQGIDGGHVPVVRLGGAFILADAVVQRGEDQRIDFFGGDGGERWANGCSRRRRLPVATAWQSEFRRLPKQPCGSPPKTPLQRRI